MTRTLLAGLAAVTLVTVEQEIEVGRHANANIRKEAPELRDAAVVRYVEDVGRRLVRHAGGPRYPYSFHVADYREINALALPGGPVWINRGVLQAAARESQLAAVLAHEIAHVAERHAAGQLTRATVARFGLAFLGAMLGNDGGAAAARAAAGFLTGGAFLGFSRDDEREADRAGLAMMSRAGWDGRGMMELLSMLRQAQARDPGVVDRFLSTHPPLHERVERLRGDPALGRGGRRDSAGFRAVRKKLLAMPPARSMPRSGGGRGGAAG